MESTEVVIIGGGATGAGILWDLSLRGISALLLEQGDMAHGATGRCHGLLHSGGRYVVKDPRAAADCMRENRIVKRIAPHCVEDTGGLFVLCAQDDPAYFDQWRRAAEKTGIRSERLSAEEARALEPNLASDILGAFTCPDAHVDAFRLVLANLEAAVERGGRFETYSKVTAMHLARGRVRGIHYRNTRTGEERDVSCELAINAAGGWAQEIAALAKIDVPVRCDKGTLLVVNHRLNNRVINRCRQPGDADILVPGGPVCILGTSSMHVPGPDGLAISPEEINELVRLGDVMVPGLAEARILRAFCGVRPLYALSLAKELGGREISRGFSLIDHKAQDGLDGLVSIIGGKLTTYRLMAAAVCDCVAAKLGVAAECATETTPLRHASRPKTHRPSIDTLPWVAVEKLNNRQGAQAARVLDAIELHPELAEIVCECELVTRAEVEFVLSSDNPLRAQTIADIGRRTRLGFGPCQGTFCGYKAMLAGFQNHLWPAAQAAEEFSSYLRERWQGQSMIHRGEQVEQFAMGRELYGANGDAIAGAGDRDE